jgi:predicted TIM-barrel fold metal-dependent hydrolase
MIIDSHAHIFQHWAGACGHPSRAVHWKYIQAGVTHPSATVRRARDGAPGDPQDLFRASDNGWSGLRDDIGFRVGPYGRLEYTVEGEDYYIQYMPVGMAELEAPPERMLAQMSYAGVDAAVLQAGMAYGLMNDYNAFAQHQYPAKFIGLLHVDEPLADTPRWMREVERAHRELGLRGVYYDIESFARYGFKWSFDDRRFDAFWEMVASLQVPVFFEASSIPDHTEASYLTNLTRLDTLLARFPHVRWVLVMGPSVPSFAKRGEWHFPDQAAKTYARDNLQFEVLYPISWGGVWDYPYPEAQQLIRGLRDRYGAEKLVWGSDMPNVERFCTYRQCLNYVLRYCDYLSSHEKDLILGRNVAELFNIGATGASGAIEEPSRR